MVLLTCIVSSDYELKSLVIVIIIVITAARRVCLGIYLLGSAH